jgi:hypothetical protein
MQNAKWLRRTRGQRKQFCILHFAFCIHGGRE